MVGTNDGPSHGFLAGSARAALCVLAGFAADLVFAACTLDLPLNVQPWLGAFVGFALVGTFALPFVLLGAWCWPWLRGVLRDDAAITRAHPPAHASATWLATACVVPGYLCGSWLIAQESILRIVRPENAALALAALQLLWTALAWLVLGFLRALLFALLSRSPTRAARALASPRKVLLGIAALACAGTLALAFSYRSLVLALPWVDIAHVAAILASAAASGWLYRGVRSRLGVLGAYGFMLVCAWLLTPFVKARDYVARDLFERELVTAAPLTSLYTWATDWDRDGHRGSIGGADCQTHNPRVHPGAADIPGNKLDEDCDGQDVGGSGAELLSGRSDHVVPSSVPARMSIVLITIDAFAAAHLKSFGYQRDPAPELERLIASGALFEHCFAQGPSTRLSIPSLFTSHYDSMIAQELVGRFPYPIDARNLSLPEVLKGAGYHTMAVVPAAYFSKAKWRGLNQGFDVFDESVARGEPAFNAEHVTGAAVAQLRLAAKQAKPVFLWTHYFDPHAPHASPPRPRFAGTRLEDVYDSELAYTDRYVGELIAEAKKLLGKDTLFVVTGDHGYGFGGRRYARHGYGYDLNSITLHVPLIVAAPYIPHARIASLCSTMDVAPTLANLARVTRKLPFQGFSLIPELLRGDVARPQLLFHQYFLPEKLLRGKDPMQKVAVRTPLYNFVLDRVAAKPSLFHWRDDYAEVHDLIGETGAAQVADELTRTLAQFTFAATKHSEVSIHPSMLAKTPDGEAPPSDTPQDP